MYGQADFLRVVLGLSKGEGVLDTMVPTPTVEPPLIHTNTISDLLMIMYVKYNNMIMYFKNSLIIHEENTKKNHKRVVSLYVDKDFPSFT